LTLRRKLYDLKLQDVQSVQKHLKALTEIFYELGTSKVVHVLASLLISYDMLVTALEAGSDVPQLEVVTQRLLHEESKRKSKDTPNAGGKSHDIKTSNSKEETQMSSLWKDWSHQTRLLRFSKEIQKKPFSSNWKVTKSMYC